MTSQIPVAVTSPTELQGQSSGVRGQAQSGQLNNRGGIAAFDSESVESEPIMSPENRALDSELRSYELKQRQVQMMAFGTTPVFRLVTT